MGNEFDDQAVQIVSQRKTKVAMRINIGEGECIGVSTDELPSCVEDKRSKVVPPRNPTGKDSDERQHGKHANLVVEIFEVCDLLQGVPTEQKLFSIRPLSAYEQYCGYNIQ